jgi:hypothetical protein
LSSDLKLQEEDLPKGIASNWGAMRTFGEPVVIYVAFAKKTLEDRGDESK